MGKKPKNYDFAGWATVYDNQCSDGRTIIPGSFAHSDGAKVPLIWNHQHNSADNVLGHCILDSRPEGMYAYGYFNSTGNGNEAKEMVMHGDIDALSIFANHLKEKNGFVSHGEIREVSLVLAGANIGAKIDEVIEHDDENGKSAIIYSGETGLELSLSHSDDEEDYESDEYDEYDDDSEEIEDEEDYESEDYDEYDDEDSEEIEDEEDYESDEYDEYDDDSEEIEHSDTNTKTYKEIYDSLTPEQKMLFIMAINDATDGGNENMAHNAFESTAVSKKPAVDIAEFEKSVMKDIKRFGSLRESFLQHAQEVCDDYNEANATLAHADGTDTPDEVTIDDVKDMLNDFMSQYPRTEYDPTSIGFRAGDQAMILPNYHELNTPPKFISRDMAWVSNVLSSVKNVPWSRIKMTFADITEDEARAKGYMKGHYKKNELFTLLKRTSAPCTIYKKKSVDRDDIIDITDFDMVNWIKGEMSVMINEEKARAILIGDGRPTSDEDKIDENCIRPVVNDADLFVLRWGLAKKSGKFDAKEFINTCIRSRKNYKGSGHPTLYTTEDVLTEMLLLEDTIGHKLYDTEEKLRTALRVSNIVTVPVLENFTDKDSKEVYGIIVNLADYNVGTDRKGERNLFDDFDIDYNKYKYLIEERFSGSLVTPFSAIVIRDAQTTGSQEVALNKYETDENGKTVNTGAAAPYKAAKD